MRLSAAKSHDTLDEASLPPTDNTELNYRTQPLSPQDQQSLTLRVLFSAALFVAPLGLVVSWFLPIKSIAIPLLVTGVVVFLARAFWEFVRSRKPGFELLAGGVIIAASILGWLFHSIPSNRLGYGLAFPLVVIAVACFSLLLAKQIAFWMANHPKVEWEVSRKWEGYFPVLHNLAVPAECPEIRGLIAAPILFVLAYGFGWLVLLRIEETPIWEFASVWGMFGFLLGLAVLTCAWNWSPVGSWLSPFLMLRVTWQAIKVWSTYNLRETKAAGVFRFPTLAFRGKKYRDAISFGALVIVGAGIIACLPSLFPTFKPDPVNAAKVPFIFPHEDDFLKTLSPEVADKKRKELLMHRTPQPPPPKTWGETTGVACLRAVIGGLLLILGPAFFMVVISWATVGPLLTRYYLALEAPNGYAQSKDSEWDIYVNRILESNDALEKEHLLLGFSVFCDYPVLLHKDILDQHYHMTGDTGAAKTSLGISPVATQLVARGGCSVVIIDLKGDMSLFETTRLEAERAGTPFRWFSSEPGKTSHVFNPFLQSHLAMLTPEQRTESLLQAMSLDYGIGYGKSYFTAMNEVVLKSMLKKFSISSFKELEGYLEDPASYTQGKAKDLEQARHLAVIVNRLSAMYPLNVVPGKSAETDMASHHAIDAMDILHRPQVLYFFLSSPQEPIGAPSVAKLFLWALFSGAARKPSRNNRVYVFVDEFQQIISDSVKLVFEQIRDQGVTMIIAHQTAGQLLRQGTDLSETVESCTAVKQVFRASDLQTMKKLEESSGLAVYHTVAWSQEIDAALAEEGLEEQLTVERSEEGIVQVSETVGPRLNRNTIIQVSAHPLASFVRFTTGKGYTQFAGYTTPIISMYTITEIEYQKRKRADWPTVPGTVVVPYPAAAGNPKEGIQEVAPKPQDSEDEEDWDDRLRRGLLS